MAENEHDEIITAPENQPDPISVEGDSNGLPPAAPETSIDTPVEVVELEQWFHHRVKNTVHAQDKDHYNELFRLKEALRLKLHSKHPFFKEG